MHRNKKNTDVNNKLNIKIEIWLKTQLKWKFL